MLRFPHFQIFHIRLSRFGTSQASSSLRAPRSQHTSVSFTVSPARFFCTKTVFTSSSAVVPEFNLKQISRQPQTLGWLILFSPTSSFPFPSSPKLSQLVIDLLTQPVLSRFLFLLVLLFPLTSFALLARAVSVCCPETMFCSLKSIPVLHLHEFLLLVISPTCLFTPFSDTGSCLHSAR